MVLNRLKRFALYANLKKYKFSTKKVEFLGYIVSTDGVSINPNRVTSIKEWLIFISFKKIQVFLGFANFYRRFIAKYSKIIFPLTGLLQEEKNGKYFNPFR